MTVAEAVSHLEPCERSLSEAWARSIAKKHILDWHTQKIGELMFKYHTEQGMGVEIVKGIIKKEIESPSYLNSVKQATEECYKIIMDEINKQNKAI
jgi:hypothetical protein